MKRERPSGFNWLKTRPALVAEREAERHSDGAKTKKEKALLADAAAVTRGVRKSMKRAARGL